RGGGRLGGAQRPGPARPAARVAVALLAGRRALLGARHLAGVLAHLLPHRPDGAARGPGDPDVAAARTPLHPDRPGLARGRPPAVASPPGVIPGPGLRGGRRAPGASYRMSRGCPAGTRPVTVASCLMGSKAWTSGAR